MLRRVTMHQLRLLAALAHHMNMTRAAEEMHMTPSAFSIQIKQLADALGAPLHEQAGKRLFLTEAGRAGARAAREILARLDGLGQELAEMRGLERGELRLAMITTARYFATRLIGDFCRLHPKIELIMAVVNRDQMLERMAQNRDDLYIMGRIPPDMEVEAFAIAENPLIVVAAPIIRCAPPAIFPRQAWKTSLSCCASRAPARVRRRSVFSPATRSARRRA